MPYGKVIDSRDVQPSKAESPMNVTPFGMSMDLILVHSLKPLSLILVSVLGRDMDSMPVER